MIYTRAGMAYRLIPSHFEHCPPQSTGSKTTLSIAVNIFHQLLMLLVH